MRLWELLPPQSHSRGCRVDVLAHPLAVCLGSLVSRLGLIHLDVGLWIPLMLCLFPFLGNLGGSKMSDTEPKGWLFSAPARWEGNGGYRASRCALLTRPRLAWHLPYLGIGLLIGVHKHCGCTYTHFLLVAERLREQASRPPQTAPSGRGVWFFLATYLRTVSFGVTLHILHGCQCVKAPNNPAAERQSWLGPQVP